MIRSPGRRPHPDPARAPDEDEVDALAAPAPARRVRRPGGAEGAARRLDRGRRRPRRGARPRPARRPARPRQDLARADRRRRARRPVRPDRRPGARAQGRHRRFLTALEPRAVFFVDEIHRLPRAVEETFYPAMEDRQLPITVGAGRGRAGRHARPAAVHADRRDDPRRACSRRRCATASASSTGSSTTAPTTWRGSSPARRGSSTCAIDAAGAARDRRAHPRHAARRQPAAQARARLRAGARRPARSTPTVADAALDLLEVDDAGLDRLDREILATICEQFAGGPVGLSTLAVAVQEEQDTIEDVYEPYLLQQRLPQAHAARPLRHRARLPPPGPRAAGRRTRRCSDRQHVL